MQQKESVSDRPATADAAVISERSPTATLPTATLPTDTLPSTTVPTVTKPTAGDPAVGRPPEHVDPFTVDARLVAAMRAIRRPEPQIGELLRIVVGHRFYRLWGFSSVDTYVRERLGISSRKAWALLKLEKATRRSAAFSRAYHDGALPWARALALLPVIDHDTGAAWVARGNRHCPSSL